MAAKHFFFYSQQCPICSKTLSMIQGTQLQTQFIFIDVMTAKRLPQTLKGVPAILPSFQPETSILQGRHAIAWLESAMANISTTGPKIRGHPDTHGPQNPRSYVEDPGHGIVDSQGVVAKTSEKELLGNTPFEMGYHGYSDKYSFLENDTAMSHRYSYVNGGMGPGRVGESVTINPGDALKDVKGVSFKSKQLEQDLSRIQQERDSFGKPPQRF